ncbi:hypothetical protein HG471_001100 [Candidatus Saccharibacteria bacterium]|nr:hypothetical protein [Candidatus Saccharibacteria bacterium]
MQDDINLEELAKNSKPSFLKIFFIVLGTIIGVFAIAFGVVSLLKLLSNTAEKVENKKPEIAKVTEKRAPHRIDLQYLIDDWRRSQGITEESSVLIYDLNNSDIVGRFNDTKTFTDPNLVSLLVAYENYRRLSDGSFHSDDQINLKNQTALSRQDCINELFTSENTNCKDALRAELSDAILNNLLAKMDLEHLKISENNITLTATDYLKLVKFIYNSENLKSENWDKFFAHLLITGDHFALVSGINKATIFDYASAKLKTETTANTIPYFSEFSILEFKDLPNYEDRKYIVISLNQNFNPTKLTSLGRNLEERVLNER